MTKFQIHTVETAPDASQPILEAAQKAFGGMLPNLYGLLAESPPLLESYMTLGKAFSKTSLTKTEQQIVWLTVNYENECTYCMAAHSVVARGAGVADEDVAALRTSVSLSDPKHEALRRFTAHMVQARGWAEPAQVGGLLAAGYTQATVLDVILGIGHKTMSNYANHIAHTPLDNAFESAAWAVDHKQTSAAS